MWWRWCWGVGEAKRGGQAKAKIAQKKGHFTQKRPKIVDEGVLEPPKPPKNKGTYDILYVLYMI